MKSLPWIALALLAPSSLTAEDTIEQICAPFKKYQPGPAARPTEADRKTFGPAKSCLGHLYGPGVKPDYDKGRRCCLVLGECNRDLALIFANGWGTPRDLDAATWFLCRAGNEMAPFEQGGMLAFVQGLRTGKEKGPLDYCDHVTSGSGMTWCTSLDYDRKKPEWDRRIAAVEKSLSPEARKSLATLRKTAETLARADGDFMAESYRGGTIYLSMTLSGEMQRHEDFVTLLERYTHKRVPTATPETLKQADAALNAAYKTRRAEMKAEDQELEKGTAGQDSLRSAQRAWIPYRDAWIAFYRLRWKGDAPSEALDREIANALTEERTKELAELGAEP
jgi:uncharacterized protein YecT (DUF1311 family)